MKKKISLICCLLGLLGLAHGCKTYTKSEEGGASMSSAKPGEYYSFKTVEGNFKVLKVLNIDGDVIHICYYNNVFRSRPGDDVIPSLFFGEYDDNWEVFSAREDKMVTTGRKHFAATEVSWEAWQPEFLAAGSLTPEELVDYEEWKHGERRVHRMKSEIGN